LFVNRVTFHGRLSVYFHRVKLFGGASWKDPPLAFVYRTPSARHGCGAALRSGLGASFSQKPLVAVVPPARKVADALAASLWK
jgi:hypothetical protein